MDDYWAFVDRLAVHPVGREILATCGSGGEARTYSPTEFRSESYAVLAEIGVETFDYDTLRELALASTDRRYEALHQAIRKVCDVMLAGYRRELSEAALAHST